MRTLFSLLFFVSVVFSANAQAQTCKDGLAVYIAGDYAGAAAILKPLAAHGDDCAQTQLGRMYLVGQGVPKNEAIALDLFKRAAEKGNTEAKVLAADLENRKQK